MQLLPGHGQGDRGAHGRRRVRRRRSLRARAEHPLRLVVSPPPDRPLRRRATRRSRPTTRARATSTAGAGRAWGSSSRRRAATSRRSSGCKKVYAESVRDELGSGRPRLTRPPTCGDARPPRPRVRRADRRQLSRRPARLAGARRRQPARPAAARGGVRGGCPPRGACAVARLVRRRSCRVARAGSTEAPLELLGAPAALLVHELETARCAPVRRRRPTTRARRFGRRRAAAGALRRAYQPAMARVMRPRDRLGGVPVPDAGARTGGGDRHRRVRRRCSTTPSCATGRRRESGCAAIAAALRRGVRGADRRRRNRSPALARGARDDGRRARLEPAGRRVLRLPARGLGGGRDQLLRVPRRLRGPRGVGDPPAVRRAAGSSTPRRGERGRSCSSSSTPTTALVGSASSESGATRGSRGT